MLASVVLTPSSQQTFDSFVQKALIDYGVPGAAVAVIREGKPVLIKGYGVRAVGTREPVDENTVFLLASVTKALTGTLAGTLVDQGKLDVDRPIFNYLPRFQHFDPYVTRAMTTRDLLAQRTGWPAFSGDALGQIGYSRADLLPRLRFFEPAYSLRDVATYSNIGFFVAGEVEAAVGGATWDELMLRNVFGPLRMTNSNTTHKSLLVPNSTKYHMLEDGKTITIPAFNHDVLGAGGSGSSTAADLAKWLQMMVSDGQFEGRQVLKKETLADIFTRSMVSKVSFAEAPPISENTGFYYGLGVGIYDYAGVKVIEKGGGLPGVRTIVVMVPEKHAAIAVLSNMHMTAFPEAIRARFLSDVLGTSDDAANQKRIMEISKSFATLFAAPNLKPNSTSAPYPSEGLIGKYENPLYGTFEIVKRGSGLEVFAGPARKHASLTHMKNGLYWMDWGDKGEVPMDVWFTIDGDNRAVSFRNEIYGTFQRVP